MSYRTWHDYGYGICTADLSKESIMKLYKHYNEEEDCDCPYSDIEDMEYWLNQDVNIIRAHEEGSLR